MLLGVIIGSIYFILLDELIMGCVQRRIGHLNLGWYGFLSSLLFFLFYWLELSISIINFGW